MKMKQEGNMEFEKILKMGVNGKAPVIKLDSGYDMPVVELTVYVEILV